MLGFGFSVLGPGSRPHPEPQNPKPTPWHLRSIGPTHRSKTQSYARKVHVPSLGYKSFLNMFFRTAKHPSPPIQSKAPSTRPTCSGMAYHSESVQSPEHTINVLSPELYPLNPKPETLSPANYSLNMHCTCCHPEARSLEALRSDHSGRKLAATPRTCFVVVRYRV